MNRQTLTALNGSIRKWEKIVDGSSLDRGTDNCPLCKLFAKKYCEGCPVAEKAEMSGCSGTPYAYWRYGVEWKDERPFRGIKHATDQAAAKKAAVAELKFLKSLLPKEAK